MNMFWVFLIGLACVFLGYFGKVIHKSLAPIDVAVVKLTEAIDEKSTDKFLKSLANAYASEPRGIILRLESPGGTAAQSWEIYKELEHFQNEHPEIPLYGSIGAVCASGCYYIASGIKNNKLFATPGSIVGSIGVVLGAFGDKGLMEKIGIEQRTYTSGENKNFLSPFQEEVPEHKEHAQQLAKQIHQVFIDDVKKGRGSVLAVEEEKLFSGLIWSGQDLIGLGLVDGIKSFSEIVREIKPGKNQRVKDFTSKDTWTLKKFLTSNTSLALKMEM